MEYDATVKWFSVEKGYGVVDLPDGIAALHAESMPKTGYDVYHPGDLLRVRVVQTVNGRVVAEILTPDWIEKALERRPKEWGQWSDSQRLDWLLADQLCRRAAAKHCR